MRNDQGRPDRAEDRRPPTAAPPRLPGTRRFGLLTGLLVFALLHLLPAPADMPAATWAVAALAALMAVCWVTEAVPVPVTALLPIVVLPLLGVRSLDAATAPYANPLIFLFLGGFLIALGLERWGLHRRLALALLRRVGPRPDSLIAGFLIAPAALSMWLSNTATSVLVLPIVLSVAALVQGREGDNDGRPLAQAFDAALLLAIAYGATIGGLATLIGTPPNALLAAFLQQTTGQALGFAAWMLFALPLSLVLLVACWLVLTRLAFRVPHREIPGAAPMIAKEMARLGPISGPGSRVAGAVALFVLPSGRRPGERLLDWERAKRVPWGVLILFGGGLSLAGAISDSGLAAWIAAKLSALAAWPIAGVVLGVTGTVILLTELTSNTATAATFLPLLAELAQTLGHDPLVLTVPAALAASCAFMLPVATPPNAIVYGSGRVSIVQMARAGIWLNVLATLLVTALCLLFVPLVFGTGP